MKKQKKLAINKVTLRNLDEPLLDAVAGAATNVSACISACGGTCGATICNTGCNRQSYCVCPTGTPCTK